MRAHPKYELFVDMGEGEDGALSVERTKVATAFPKVGHAMIFLFDYGDDWMFQVELRGDRREGGRHPVSENAREAWQGTAAVSCFG